MARGTVTRSRASALLRRVTLVVPFLLVAGLIPGPVRAADPPNVDVLPAPAVGRLGGPAGPVAAIPPGSDGVTESPRVVFHGPRTDRVVALTFDDGYAPANVRQIFEELTRAGVAATPARVSSPKIWRTFAGAYPSSKVRATTRSVRGP